MISGKIDIWCSQRLPQWWLLFYLPTYPINAHLNLHICSISRYAAWLLSLLQPPAHSSLDLLFICLLSFTVSFNSPSWSDVTAIRVKQISSPIPHEPSLGNQGHVHYLFHGVEKYTPVPSTPRSPFSGRVRRSKEDNSKTCGPSFLLYFVPRKLALVLSLSSCLYSTCFFIIFFGAWLTWNALIWVWTQNNSSETASPTCYQHGHSLLAKLMKLLCNRQWKSKIKTSI